MAQTRACAKVLRDVFSHIVILAGFQATPAEEMTEHDDRGPRDDYAPDAPETAKPKPSAKGSKKGATAKPEPPKAAVAPPPAAAPPPPPKPNPPAPPSVNSRTTPPPVAAPKKLSQAQVRRFWTIARSNHWENEQVHKMLLKEAKVDHTEDIPQGRDSYDRIVDKILIDGPQVYFAGRA